jgi:NAD/NADP transhydrogenase beta subunit
VTQDLTTASYLCSAICFIMALRGLSSPETARRQPLRHRRHGDAIATTLAQPGW